MQTKATTKLAQREFEQSLDRIYYYAAYADKYDGLVHDTTYRNVTLAMPEPLGVMGIICPNEAPLLGMLSLVLPAIAMGNNVVVIPSEQHPLSTTDFYQVIETSDVPAGTINIVTGPSNELAMVLASHDDVDGLWYFGNRETSKQIEVISAENMKRTWVSHGKTRDWIKSNQGEGEEFLRRCTQVKNIWIPYGE